MLIKALTVGEIETNCYIAADEETKETAIIDPGDEPERILKYIKEQGLKVTHILLTHGHFDHVTGLDGVRKATDAQVYIHKADINKTSKPSMGEIMPFKGLLTYDEGDEVKVGGMTFRVLSTPGHTPGSVVLLCGDAMFSGDTLFQGSCGRTDFPRGSWPQMMASLKRLYELDGDYRVYSGHGFATKLSTERSSNMYMREALDE